MFTFFISLRIYQKVPYAKNFLISKLGPEEMLNTIKE